MDEEKAGTTVGELFDLLIEMEKATQTFYLRLTEMFAHEPRAAEVWWLMAADEGSHAQLLERTRDALTPEQLAAPAPPALLKSARAIIRFDPERALAGIETLDDAYEMAHAGENSEINAIFEILLSTYFPTDIQHTFIQSQLREHVDRLARLVPPEWRQTVRARREVKAQREPSST